MHLTKVVLYWSENKLVYIPNNNLIFCFKLKTEKPYQTNNQIFVIYLSQLLLFHDYQTNNQTVLYYLQKSTLDNNKKWALFSLYQAQQQQQQPNTTPSACTP